MLVQQPPQLAETVPAPWGWHLPWLKTWARGEPRGRPPARPQRVFAARRRLQDRADGGAGGRSWDAGARAHRPRRDERLGRALQGLQGRTGSSRSSASRPTWSTIAQATRATRYERNHLTLLAASDAGFRNLVQLSSAGFLEGFSRGKANVDMELLDRHSEGVIALTGCLQSRFCRRLVEDAPRRRPRPPRRADRGLRARAGLLRGPEERHPRAGQGQRGHRPLRPRAGAAAGRHRRRPLPAPRGLRQPRGAALRADQVDAGGAEAHLRHQRVLPEEPEEMAESFAGPARGAGHDAGDRRALRGRDRARQAAAAALPDAGRPGAPARCCGRSGAEGLARRYGDPAPGRGPGAARVRARRDRGDGLRVLLPDRLGLRPLREGERHRGRPRPRLGGRLDRRLSP